MDAVLQSAILAVTGAVTGVAAHYLTSSIKGSTAKAFVLRYVFESAVLVPGLLLVGLFIGGSSPPEVAVSFRLTIAFGLPYVGGRLAAAAHVRRRRAVREIAFPFQYWFDLLRRDAEAARTFLRSYLTDYARRESNPIDGLHAAHFTLAKTHAADPLLPVALQELRGEIERRQHLRVDESGERSGD